jgi:nucleoside 2-deoxyribosyltransferase
MIVAGGTYLEVCLRPEWRRLFGSGLRAASAVARLSPGTVLHTYGFEKWKNDIEHSASALQCQANVCPIKDAISFSYDHPLSVAVQHPLAPKQNPSLRLAGTTVLRFGFVEGDAVVDARHAVYDPQSRDPSTSFRSNGSAAEHLAVVLNEDEAMASGCEGRSTVEVLMDHHGAEVVIVKRGPRGATVYLRSGPISEIRPYWSDSVFKIGSGDVFSATFALYWGERGVEAEKAADLASRSVAQFVDGHVLPLDDAEQDIQRLPVTLTKATKIYLAGPFFDLAQRWMIEETLRTLTRLGAEVFSPLHEVGTEQSSAEIAQADLRGLRHCSKVLALLDGMDPGTVFEVGYARALDIPVVALIERFEPEHLTMLEGSGCDIVTDFSTAIYRTLWTAGR